MSSSNFTWFTSQRVPVGRVSDITPGNEVWQVQLCLSLRPLDLSGRERGRLLCSAETQAHLFRRPKAFDEGGQERSSWSNFANEDSFALRVSPFTHRPQPVESGNPEGSGKVAV